MACATATRVKTLMPVLFGLYHPEGEPLHCLADAAGRADGRVNGSDAAAAASEWVDPVSGQRHATRVILRTRRTAAGKRSRARVMEKVPIVCDAFAGNESTDCSLQQEPYRGICEAIERSIRLH